MLVEESGLELDREKMRKLFPNLLRELESERGGGYDQDTRRTRPFEGYQPDVVDFIQRCDDEAQAIEIIDFLERRGELTKERSDEIRRQLRLHGVRSFGPKRGDDFYLKASAEK